MNFLSWEECENVLRWKEPTLECFCICSWALKCFYDRRNHKNDKKKKHAWNRFLFEADSYVLGKPRATLSLIYMCVSFLLDDCSVGSSDGSSTDATPAITKESAERLLIRKGVRRRRLLGLKGMWCCAIWDGATLASFSDSVSQGGGGMSISGMNAGFSIPATVSNQIRKWGFFIKIFQIFTFTG